MESVEPFEDPQAERLDETPDIPDEDADQSLFVDTYLTDDEIDPADEATLLLDSDRSGPVMGEGF